MMPSPSIFVSRFARRRIRRVAILPLVVLSALLVAGCGSDDSPAVEEAQTAAKRGEPLDPDFPVVEIATTSGAIRVKLDAVKAPNTVRNFLFYLRQGFYDDTLIHYVAADKMIVGGGYGVDAKPQPAGTTVRNEAHNGLKNVRGTLAMARDGAAGIDNATSQFFINLVDAPTFDHRGDEASEYGYCVFGSVIEGLEVADAISQSPTNDLGGDLGQTPVPQVVVKSVRIVE